MELHEDQEAAVAAEHAANAPDGAGDGPGEAGASSSGRKSVGLELTKLKSSYSLLAQKQKDLVENITKEAEEVIASIKSAYESEPADAEALINDIQRARDDAIHQASISMKQELEDLDNKVKESKTIETAKIVEQNIIATGKRMNKGNVKSLRALIGKTKKHLAAKARQARSGGTGNGKGRGKGAAVASTASMPPLHAIGLALDEANVGVSIHDAKAGVHIVRFITGLGCDPIGALKGNAFVKKHIKDAEKTQKQTGNTWATSPLLSTDPKNKKVLKILKQNIDPLVLTKHILPDEPWAKKVYQVEVVAEGPKHHRVGGTHFGGMEVRCYLQGNESVIGIPYDMITGATYREKSRTISCMAIDALKQIIQTAGGFVCQCKVNDLIIIPSGFFMIDCGENNALYLRWPCSGDAPDTGRASITLKKLVDEHPEIRRLDTGYTQLLTVLS